MLIVFVLTALVSATLLFLVQPMFARMVLPMLGGSPAVWNTAMVFYQVTLLAGYAYAHLVTTRLTPRRQALVHLVLVAGALASLPIAVPQGWAPPTDRSPVPWMLALLTVGIGLPFFVVSTTGPLVQKWFAGTDHRSASDPYFLYAASNAGSMAGLLGYPLWLEPRLRLADQSLFWTAGYGMLALLIAGCAFAALRAPVAVAAAPSAARALGFDVARVPLTVRRRFRWVLLAFAPSSLMIGVTTHLTTDIAAIPLLWVVPLTIYLASFVLVFASRPPIPHAGMARALPLIVLPLIMVLQARAEDPLWMIVGLHLLLLFVASMVCHGELAKDRPPAEHLTEFYLWLAVGGALGGVFNALVAPLVFRSVIEYPIAIVLACLLMPPRATLAPGLKGRVLDFAIPAALGVLASLAVSAMAARQPLGALHVVLLWSVLAFPLFACARRPVRFALGLAAILLVNPAARGEQTRLLIQERSFFGVNRVVVDPSGRFHELIHGTTLHGVQRIAPPGCDVPLSYYHRGGPAGDVFDALVAHAPPRRLAVAGLGAGGLAAYARPGDRWDFFEIDPVVARIARDTSLFCFLEHAPADVGIVLGDARRSLESTDARYDLMVFDAYTSDAIPVHLLTREALALYVGRLAPGGVLAFHLSNRYFDLVPVVATLAADAGLACRVRQERGITREQVKTERITPSTYAIVARDAAHFGALDSDSNWVTPAPRATTPLWTDDFSSLLAVLR